MTQVVASLSEISARYDAVFCDLWGCLHNGVATFPAAVAALQAFRAKGGRVILLTNAPRPNMIIIKQLDGMGVPRDAWDAVVSAGDSAQYAMLSGAVGRQVFHIGAPKDESFFTDFSDELADLAIQSDPITRVAIKDATGIVCTGLADDLFISGGISAAEFGADSANPDKALLESWLESKMLSPAFSMGHLR